MSSSHIHDNKPASRPIKKWTPRKPAPGEALPSLFAASMNTDFSINKKKTNRHSASGNSSRPIPPPVNSQRPKQPSAAVSTPLREPISTTDTDSPMAGVPTLFQSSVSIQPKKQTSSSSNQLRSPKSPKTTIAHSEQEDRRTISSSTAPKTSPKKKETGLNVETKKDKDVPPVTSYLSADESTEFEIASTEDGDYYLTDDGHPNDNDDNSSVSISSVEVSSSDEEED